MLQIGKFESDLNWSCSVAGKKASLKVDKPGQTVAYFPVFFTT